jgi:hypothetical protein
MAWKYNPFLGTKTKLDRSKSTSELDNIYVKKSGDTMTGMLTITPAGDISLTANKDIILKAGQKLIFDGA